MKEEAMKTQIVELGQVSDLTLGNGGTMMERNNVPFHPNVP